MDSFAIKHEFEKRLDELGLSYQARIDNSYLLGNTNRVEERVIVKLLSSGHVDQSSVGSQNGNKVQSIGVFKLKLSSSDSNTDFFVLGFTNITYQRIDFVIIPTEELKRRQVKKNRIFKESHSISIVFWIMDDIFLYECSSVGVEWEWYYLSQGLNGRMIDGSFRDYSDFLNDWKRLMVK